MRLHAHRLGAIGFATLASVLLPAPTAMADDTHVQVRIGGDDWGVGVGYHDRDDDRRRSWPERVDRNFDRLSGDRGEIRQAQRRFSVLASERPSAPMPRIGLAIAATLLGDDWEARRQFQRAVVEQPGALARAPIDGALHDRLHRVKEHLERRARHVGDGGDWFVLASLHVLTGHEGRARSAIRNAFDCGERGAAADRLAHYLGVRVDRGRRDRDRGQYDDRRKQRRGQARRQRGRRH